jgi:hypothetical protein
MDMADETKMTLEQVRDLLLHPKAVSITGNYVQLSTEDCAHAYLAIDAEIKAREAAHVTELIEAADAYFNDYCRDEADDWFDAGESFGENTGCSKAQTAAANRLRDAISRMRSSLEAALTPKEQP